MVQLPHGAFALMSYMPRTTKKQVRPRSEFPLWCPPRKQQNAIAGLVVVDT